MTDKEKFLEQARSYIGVNGNYVCNTKLHLKAIYDWCAFAVSAIMQDCNFIGRYIKQIEGGAGSVPRESDGKYGTWFKKYTNTPQAGDLFFLRYADYPNNDKYFCDHIGIVENVNGNVLTTLEGNVDGQYGNWQTTSVFRRKIRYISNNDVYAFYRPDWNIEKTTFTSEKANMKLYQLNSSANVDYSVKVIAKDKLNIRQGAGVNYDIIGVIPYSSVVHIKKRTSGGEYKWGLTEYNGTMGWIALDYTEKINFQKGDTVKLKNGAKAYNTDIALDSWVYGTKFQIMEISGNRAVIGINNMVTSAVDIKYLKII